MLDLNKPAPPLPPEEDITKNVAKALQDKGVNVFLVSSPVIHLEKIGEGFCLEMVSRKFDDLTYALEAIVDYMPAIVFLRSVHLVHTAEGEHYRIRFQYLSVNRPGPAAESVPPPLPSLYDSI